MSETPAKYKKLKPGYVKSSKTPKPKVKRKADQIMTLALHPGIQSNRQIADVLGVAPETVSRVLSKNRDDIEEVKQRLNEMDSILTSGLSIKERGELYIKVARTNVDKYPMATLKALERMDDIHGIVTERDRIRVKLLPPENQVQQPLFMMPAGSRIKVTRESRAQQVVVEVQEDTMEISDSDKPNDVNKD